MRYCDEAQARLKCIKNQNIMGFLIYHFIGYYSPIFGHQKEMKRSGQIECGMHSVVMCEFPKLIGITPYLDTR